MNPFQALAQQQAEEHEDGAAGMYRPSALFTAYMLSLK
jgi:hypothetical protein